MLQGEEIAIYGDGFGVFKQDDRVLLVNKGGAVVDFFDLDSALECQRYDYRAAQKQAQRHWGIQWHPIKP
jgi:hypothetical protein